MQYGYFDDPSREYVITNPRTPVKWINYLGNLAFGGIVDHTGGSLICRGDPALNRITRYIAQLPSSEFKGTTLYLRFREGDHYKVFSPYFVPTLDPYDHYECHVGMGYMRIVSESYGIRTDATIFVPLEGGRVVCLIQVSNVSERKLEIDAIPVVEYTHPNALMQLTNADWVPQTMQSQSHHDGPSLLVLTQFPFMFRDTRVNYFTSNRSVSSFESERSRFLGDNEYGSWAHPLSLQEEDLSCSQASRGDNIAALLHRLGTLGPGDTTNLITQLGQDQSIAHALTGIRRYREPEEVHRSLQQLASFWDKYLAQLQVETPSVSMNSMLDVHNPRQCHTTANWSRYLSLYQMGLGARGMGFRDTAQDVMGILAQAPQEARRLISKLLQVQRQNGSAMHQFNPLSMLANEGDSREVEDRPKYYSDDHLWIVLATCAYLKETGDFAFLNEEIPYYESDSNGTPLESGTVLDHLQRAIHFTTHHMGAHGLPLLGFADWNDTVNLPSGAESVFTANLYGKALQEMMELARQLGSTDELERYAASYQLMKDAVNQHAWDGAWYARYLDADGNPLGSRVNPQGKIFANAQSWAVISGFASPVRARAALKAVHAHLHTPKGIKLSTPGYDGYDPAKGGVTTYPPGAKENGGIFLHANAWVIIAETMVGDGDRAYEYYQQINPAAKNDCIEEFQCEPYAYPQNILGDEHREFGTARNSWLTGTASWMYQAATQHILGIRPTYQGLLIDPCIPSTWDGFGATRHFQSARFQIQVRNPRRINKGVTSIELDGVLLEGNTVPLLRHAGTHQVVVVMG